MHSSETEDTTVYRVVVNHEEQYSLWPESREIPRGWKDAGKNGLKAECLEHIKEVWTDMRPLSLRKHMEQLEQRQSEVRTKSPSTTSGGADSTHEEESLVHRLSTGEHPVELSRISAETLKECLDRGYIHVKFTKTQGGTELGVRLDPKASDFSRADFQSRSGKVSLVGGLTLDYVKVRCIADIDLDSLTGLGHLEPAQA